MAPGGLRAAVVALRLLSADEDGVATAQVARVLGTRQVRHQLQVVPVIVDKPRHRDNLRGKRPSEVKTERRLNPLNMTLLH